MRAPNPTPLSALSPLSCCVLPVSCVLLLVYVLDATSAPTVSAPKLESPVLGSMVLLYLAVLHSSRMYLLGSVYLAEILWGCNVALALCGWGVLRGNTLLVGTGCCVVAVDQLCWYIDVAGWLATGQFPVGVAKYMAHPSTTKVHIVTGTHHLWFLPLALTWLEPAGGLPAGCYFASVCSTAFIACAARSLTPFSVQDALGKVKVWNINLAYEFYADVPVPWLHALDHSHPALYLPFLVGVCNCVLNVLPVAVVIALSRLSTRDVSGLLSVADFRPPSLGSM